MAGATDGLPEIDLTAYVAPVFAGMNPTLGCDLTRFLYLQDKAQSNLAEDLRRDPTEVYKWPVIQVRRSLSVSGLASGLSTSVEFNPNGGMNAIVMSVNAYVYTGTTAVDSGLIDYKDVDANKFEWVESTSLYNVHATGQLPGVLFPQKYLGNSRHTITLTNNTAGSVNIKLSYICMIVGRLSAY